MKPFYMALLMASVGFAQQLGMGMNSSMFGLGQNCGAGSQLSMQMPMPTQRQASQPTQKNNKEDLAEIKSLNKEKSQKKKELLQAQRELQTFDSKLRNLFDTSAYDFIKEHFDSERHCQDYKGFSEGDKSANLNFPISKMSSDWPQLCDVENNLQGQLKPTICSKNYLLRVNDSSCASVVAQYPVAKHRVDNLKKEVEDIEGQISSLKESMKSEQDSDGANGGLGVDTLARDSSETEGGVCLECMGRGSAPGGRSAGSGINLTSLLTNSAMAFASYSSTNDFYSNMADKNANLGFPTSMPSSSPMMAASPYLSSIVNSLSGMGNSNCGNQMGTNVQMGSNMLGGFSQLGGMQLTGNSGLQFNSGLGLQSQLYGLNQRLPYLQSPYSINSSLYYGNAGLNTGYNTGYSYNNLYSR